MKKHLLSQVLLMRINVLVSLYLLFVCVCVCSLLDEKIILEGFRIELFEAKHAIFLYMFQFSWSSKLDWKLIFVAFFC